MILFSIDCEKCIEEIEWLARQPERVQQQVDLVSVSTLEETNIIINEMNLLCNVYIDSKREFQKKCNMFLTPSYFVFEGVSPVEIYGELEQIVE